MGWVSCSGEVGSVAEGLPPGWMKRRIWEGSLGVVVKVMGMGRVGFCGRWY